jgi:hypothetical protein
VGAGNEGEGPLERTDSLMRGVAIALAGFALICAGVLAGAADGKKKHKGAAKVTVVSSQQQAILNAGKISLRVKGAKGRKVRVDGIQAAGKVSLTKPKKVKGKKLSVPLSAGGRTALGSCSVDGLRGRLVGGKKGGKKSGKKKKKGAKTPITPLVRDLAACNGPQGPHCDPFDPSQCMQPFPNDYFTVADPSTPTGRRLDFHADQMPQNKAGVPIDPTDFNRADGFSPGSAITVKIPGVQTQQAFDNTGFVPITDPARYADSDQPAVVIDANTGQRHPIFAELDANPNHYEPGDTADVNLIIRPTTNFEEGHRYIVALRNLRDASNNPVPAPEAFRVYRDNVATTDQAVEARRAHMEEVLNTLQGDGIDRGSLYMAWDFTVASEHSLAGRALAIRDDALHQLGDDTPGDGLLQGSAPSFHISSVQDAPDPDVPANTLRLIDGELTNVPCYLDNGDCHPGGRFNFQSNGDVNATPTGIADDPDTGTTGVRFECVVPNSALTGGTTVNPTESGIFGHGLLGDFTQVDDMIRFSNSEANIANTTWCATNWAGFSSDDIGNVISALGDLSGFTKLTDRMQQGFVNMIYLGRAMTMSGGFDTDPAFQLDPDGVGGNPPVPILNTGPGHLYWEGISQGAIMGGALTALEPDLTQSVLDVVGMNYSTLLQRSTDSGQYLDTPNIGLWANYPGLDRRPLILSLMQLLWDRGEADGYAHHMTDDPLPNTPEHHVLLQAAYGDHQVSNLTAEVEARTIGAKVEDPELDSGRHWATDPLFGLTPIPGGSYPYDDPAALVYYDGGPLNFPPSSGTPAQTCTDENGATVHGTAPAPIVNLPPNPVSVYGCDPHQYPRRSADGVGQAASWLSPDAEINQCKTSGTPRPCYSNGYTGP